MYKFSIMIIVRLSRYYSWQLKDCDGSNYRLQLISNGLWHVTLPSHVMDFQTRPSTSGRSWYETMDKWRLEEGWKISKWVAWSLLYHPPTFHMESMWNGHIPWIPHGFHMEYVLTYKSSTYYNGFHVHSMCTHSTWIPCGTYPILRWNKDLRT